MKKISTFNLIAAFGISFILFSNDGCNTSDLSSSDVCNPTTTNFDDTWLAEDISAYRSEDMLSIGNTDLNLLYVQRFVSSENDVMYIFTSRRINADNMIVGPLYQIKSCSGEIEYTAYSISQLDNYFDETFYGEEVELETIVE